MSGNVSRLKPMSFPRRTHNCMTARTCIARFMPGFAEERTARHDAHHGWRDQSYGSHRNLRVHAGNTLVAFVTWDTMRHRWLQVYSSNVLHATVRQAKPLRH